ncbi:hypothetical protein BsIDN1_62990 [Bacillus safensis]|uniref:Uncharacterized protein n=1 Tax=Bacillus safensis TaxID=561879 RepID=A0A5S9MI99_BACIA|nr:hypothetical protein BsIDN1_62990 [Bacillus safensis]
MCQNIETYRDKLRGFYFDFEQEAPGPLVKETESVIDWVRETEQPDFTLPASFLHRFMRNSVT